MHRFSVDINMRSCVQKCPDSEFKRATLDYYSLPNIKDLCSGYLDNWNNRLDEVKGSSQWLVYKKFVKEVESASCGMPINGWSKGLDNCR